MSRLVLDSVNFRAVTATRWPHLIGYVNGRVSAWSTPEIEATRQAGQLLALVDVLGNSPLQAAVLDFERGDVQSPAVVRAWLQARNQYRDDGTVYCSKNSIPAVVSGLRGEHCNLWVVDLTDDAEPPFTVPDYGPLPPGVRVIARQFVLGPRSGGNYDLSVWYADDWHPDQAHPAHYVTYRAAVAADLGPYEGAVPAAELTNPITGDIAAAPDPAIVQYPPAGELPGQLGLPGVDVGQLGQVPDVDHAAAELISAAAFAAAAAPVPVLHDDSTNAGLAAAASPSTPAPAAAAADPGSATAAAAAAPAQSTLNPTLNHDFIRATLTAVGEVAKMFHAGGWHAAADDLERAASLAWEIGGALKAAGL